MHTVPHTTSRGGVVQSLATTVSDDSTGADIQIVVFPSSPQTDEESPGAPDLARLAEDLRRSLDERAERGISDDPFEKTVGDLLGMLERRLKGGPRLGRDPNAVPTQVELYDLMHASSEDQPPTYVDDFNEVVEWLAGTIYAPNAQRREDRVAFAEYALRAELIPWRENPIGGETIARLFASANPGTGAGAVIGCVAGHDSALLLLTVPGGMLICGTAYAVSTALETGLKEKVLRMINPPPPPEVPPGD